MVSIRFPFSFSQRPANSSSHRSFSPGAVGCTLAAAGVIFVATNQNSKIREKAFSYILDSVSHSSSSPFWASLSLSESPSSPSMIESRTGASFPAIINNSQRLLGIGLRKKSVFGLKNIDVYAFGVYADDFDVKKCLDEKYGNHSASASESKEDLRKDLLEADVSMTVRLQIVYGRLNIRSVRSAFEESVGSRLQKFGGSDNKELLERFTSLFRDEYKIPRGSVIELSRDKGHVLCIKIDGTEVGSIQSKLLCKSLFDLYVGDDPFDHKAKEDVANQLKTFLENVGFHAVKYGELKL
ncbi:hypothetical protein V2J09_016273 [Rumex salicifolius]